MAKPKNEPKIHCRYCGSETWIDTELPCSVCTARGDSPRRTTPKCECAAHGAKDPSVP